MNALHRKGARFPGLLAGGLLAGALGLALAATGTSSSSTTQDPAAGKSGSRTPGMSGRASADTGMNAAGSASGSQGSRSSAGTASPSSTGKYGSGMEGASSLPPNVTPGWKIRVCSEKTKADQIQFKFTPEGKKGSKGGAGTGATGSSGSTGMGGSGSSSGSSNPANDASVNAALSEQTASWSRGEASEINLPSSLRDADKIRIEATPSQKDKKASICVIYDDHVAKKLSFDDREVSTVKNTDNGECGC
jgi:hypothetical protein